MLARLASWLLRAMVPFQKGDERAALARIAEELRQL